MNTSNAKKLNVSTKFSDYCLSPEEDAQFMAGIDMDAMERGIKKSEEEIANGKGIEFKEAMAQIHKEVFGEEL